MEDISELKRGLEVGVYLLEISIGVCHWRSGVQVNSRLR